MAFNAYLVFHGDAQRPDPPPPPPPPPDGGTPDGGTKKMTAYQQLDLATQAWINQRVSQIVSTGSFTLSQQQSLIQEIQFRFGQSALSGTPSLADIVCALVTQALALNQAHGGFVGLVVKSGGGGIVSPA